MAVPFYIAEGLLNSFPGLAWAAYKGKKTDPFKESGIVNPKPTTQSKTGGPSRRNFGPMPIKKRKRTYTSRTPYTKKYKVTRRSTKKRKRKLTKKTYKRKKTKYVSLTVGTARERYQSHFARTGDGVGEDSVYTGFTNVGPMAKAVRMVAQAFMLHYMHRVGDYRASKTIVPVGLQGTDATAGTQVCTWTNMYIHWSSQFTQDNNHYQDIIYSRSAPTTVKSLEELTVEVAALFLSRFKNGWRISQVQMSRGIGEEDAIMQDISAGSNLIEFAVKSCLKVQNVTLGDGTDQDNMLSIRRNPLDGMIYHFRNRIPQFKMQYWVSKDAAERSKIEVNNENFATQVNGMNIPAYGDMPEFKIPPKVPSTIWKNVASKSTISIQPGAHRVVTDYEFYRGTVNSFADRYIPIEIASSPNTYNAPPGGKSVIIGLKPTYRNGQTEDCRVECEVDYFYTARLGRAKITPLPTTAIVA
jgi:hypothetical protein